MHPHIYKKEELSSNKISNNESEQFSRSLEESNNVHT